MRTEPRQRIHALAAAFAEVVRPARAAHDRAARRGAHHHEPDAWMARKPLDEPRIVPCDLLERDAAGKARERHVRKIAGRGDDDVWRRIAAGREPARLAAEGRVEERAAEPADPRGFRHE